MQTTPDDCLCLRWVCGCVWGVAGVGSGWGMGVSGGVGMVRGEGYGGETESEGGTERD